VQWLPGPSAFYYHNAMKAKPGATPVPPPTVEICILAGGLSSRMGRDKARLRLGGQSLLARVRSVAAGTPWPVRVIRRDLVPRCGPLGGVCTALQTTRAEAVLFLACDMPFVSAAWIGKLVKLRRGRHGAVFTLSESGPGFPFLLCRAALPQVEEQVAARRFSMQSLAAKCRARMMRAPGGARTLFNVNTPADWRAAGVYFSARNNGPPTRRSDFAKRQAGLGKGIPSETEQHKSGPLRGLGRRRVRSGRPRSPEKHF
jgi:molybdopterin-guanine dinucleotide biosynthesis protein A